MASSMSDVTEQVRRQLSVIEEGIQDCQGFAAFKQALDELLVLYPSAAELGSRHALTIPEPITAEASAQVAAIVEQVRGRIIPYFTAPNCNDQNYYLRLKEAISSKLIELRGLLGFEDALKEALHQIEAGITCPQDIDDFCSALQALVPHQGQPVQTASMAQNGVAQRVNGDIRPFFTDPASYGIAADKIQYANQRVNCCLQATITRLQALSPEKKQAMVTCAEQDRQRERHLQDVSSALKAAEMQITTLEGLQQFIDGLGHLLQRYSGTPSENLPASEGLQAIEQLLTEERYGDPAIFRQAQSDLCDILRKKFNYLSGFDQAAKEKYLQILEKSAGRSEARIQAQTQKLPLLEALKGLRDRAEQVATQAILIDGYLTTSRRQDNQCAMEIKGNIDTASLRLRGNGCPDSATLQQLRTQIQRWSDALVKLERWYPQRRQPIEDVSLPPRPPTVDPVIPSPALPANTMRDPHEEEDRRRLQETSPHRATPTVAPVMPAAQRGRRYDAHEKGLPPPSDTVDDDWFASTSAWGIFAQVLKPFRGGVPEAVTWMSRAFARFIIELIRGPVRLGLLLLGLATVALLIMLAVHALPGVVMAPIAAMITMTFAKHCIAYVPLAIVLGVMAAITMLLHQRPATALANSVASVVTVPVVGVLRPLVRSTASLVSCSCCFFGARPPAGGVSAQPAATYPLLRAPTPIVA